MFTGRYTGRCLLYLFLSTLHQGGRCIGACQGYYQPARLVANNYLLPCFKAALLQPFAAQAQVRKSYIIVAIGSHGRCAPVKKSLAHGKGFGARKGRWWCRHSGKFLFTLKQRCCIAVTYPAVLYCTKRGLVIYPF